MAIESAKIENERKSKKYYTILFKNHYHPLSSCHNRTPITDKN